jgi:RNA 2',3'-cyclic 3'-phosphodiesterase
VRLFVAVNLPPAEKDRLGAILDALMHSSLPFRWVEPESLHITLKFLGEVAEARYEAVVAGIERAAEGISPFDVDVGGFGAFPSLARPRILWMAVGASTVLGEAQRRVEHEMEILGFPPEARPFHAHVTLGRASAGAGRVDGGQLDRITAPLVYKGCVRVESIDLMRSHTASRGARYERVECITLANQLNG